MGGGSARRSADAAAQASRAEAEEMRKARTELEASTQRDKTRAQRIQMQSLRARGGGMFYSNPANVAAADGGTLG